MKNLMMIAAVALTVCVTAAGADGNLADRHVARGVQCPMCHKSAPEPGATVRKKQCLKCHVSYDALKAKTAKVKPHNPHDTHLGEEQCVRCHHGHKKSEIACKECHQFKFEKMP